MIQVIYSGDTSRSSCHYSDDTESDTFNPRSKMITIRLTEDEREQLNFQCFTMQISVQNYVRAKLGLPADVEPKEKRRGRKPRFQFVIGEQLQYEETHEFEQIDFSSDKTG